MTTIEKNVMASVALIYTLRKLVSKAAFELYICIASLWVLGQLVWVSKVFENLANAGAASSAQFIVAAILNTDAVVQLTLVVGVCAAFLLTLDVVRGSTSRPFAA